MNEDQIRGLWGQLKGRAKILLGDLLDDETWRAEGSINSLTGRLQRRFGDARQALRRGFNRLRY